MFSQTVEKTSVTFVTFADGSAQTAKEISGNKIHHSGPSVTKSFVSSFYKFLLYAAAVDVIPSSQNAMHPVMTSLLYSLFRMVISEPA